MSGERVTLRPWSLDDAGWYVEARDEIVFRYTTERRDLLVTEVIHAIEQARTSAAFAAFAIADEDGDLVGNLAIDFRGDTAEISYFLAPDGRHRGLATDAVKVALHWLRGEGVQQVVAVVARDNDASARVLKRAGLTPAGSVEHPRLGPSVRWNLLLQSGEARFDRRPSPDTDH